MDNFALEDYLNTLLDTASFQDYAPNGLQIQGRSSIRKIASAVTASLDVVEKSIALGVDALFVHHGYFWKGERSALTGIKYQRISALIRHDINLFAYHLPLDAYDMWGNNACIAKRLGLIVQEKLMWNQMRDILWKGSFPFALDPQALTGRLVTLYGPQVQHVAGGNKQIKTLAWCSGAGQDGLEHMAHAGIQAFISGEYSERSYHLARELGIDFYAIGHHASEKDGIRHLGEFLAKEFTLTHHFIDEANPF